MPPNYNGGPAPSPPKVALPPILPAPKGGNQALKGLETAPVRLPTPKPSSAPSSAPRTYSQGPGAPPIVVNQSKAQKNLAAQQLSQKLLNDSMRSLAQAMRTPAQPAPKQSALAQLATIMGSGVTSPTVDKVLGNLGKDILHLPKGLIEGTTQLGGAAIDDLLHGHFGTANLGTATGSGQPSQLSQVVSKAASQDPLVSLVSGHPGRALQQAEAHPLGAILDATGAYGVVGRAAGAAARAGMLGDNAAQAAQLGRRVEVAPGIPGTTVAKPYSPNLFTQKAQQALEAHPAVAEALRNARGAKLTDHLGVTGVPAELKRQVSTFYGPMKSAMARARTDMAKSIAASKPAGKVEANVAPYLTAFGGGASTLDHVLQTYRDAQAGMYGPLRPSVQKMLDQHVANLEAAVAKGAKLDLPAAASSANDYAVRQAALEQQKEALGLHENPELARALDKQYARMQIPGTHFLDKPVIHPDSVAARREAAATLRTATKALADAKAAAAKDAGAHAGASRAVASATQRLPLHPVTDTFQNHLLDARAAIEQSRGATAAQHASNIAALKDAVQWAKDEYKLAKDHPNKIGGLVIEDPAARPLTAGPLKDIGVRPLSSDEIRQHIAANGADPAYVNMTNPERVRSMTTSDLFGGRETGRPSATGKPFTGQAALVGDWMPGHAGLARSQLRDVMQIGQEKIRQGFIDRFGMKDQNGDYFTPHNWETAAATYEKQHGIPLTDVNIGGDRIVLIPTAAVKEIQAHSKLENPTLLGRAAMTLNRGFRNTVLPTSPKLPIMHTVENVTRAMLAGASPQSYALARSALKAMPDEARGRLQDLATPGGMGGHQARLDEEDLGRLAPTDHTFLRSAVATPAHVWSDVAHKIIGWQRALEQHAQTAALGVHMRQTLQQWGHSWADANSAVSKVADELAKGYAADPALMEDAARMVHNTMGQYNNFTARQRWFISRIAPFAPWYMNAAKLVWHGLPVGHPLKTALVTDLAQANQSQWDATHAGLPDNLQTAAALGPGHWLDVGKFTPIGIEKNPLAEGVPLLFPQYTSAALALYGKDPFGKDFRGPNTPYGKSAVEPLSLPAGLHAIDQLLQSFGGPASSIARAVEGHGATMYNTSLPMFGQVETKPNTQHGPANVLGGLERVFNPFAGVWYKNNGSAVSTVGQPPTGTVLKGSTLNLKGQGSTLPGRVLTLKGHR